MRASGPVLVPTAIFITAMLAMQTADYRQVWQYQPVRRL